MPDRFIIVHAKSPEHEASAKLMQQMVDHFLSDDKTRDELGLPRVGREPDYLNGRWCVKCHNSLPDGWTEPCDVCGAQTSGFSLSGLLAEEPCESVTIYEGIPRAPKA